MSVWLEADSWQNISRALLLAPGIPVGHGPHAPVGSSGDPPLLSSRPRTSPVGAQQCGSAQIREGGGSGGSAAQSSASTDDDARRFGGRGG